jgi:hypothetical protein
MTYYKSKRIIDGKLQLVIVDETGKIVNRNPNKVELKGLEKEPRFFRDTLNRSYYLPTLCNICGDKLKIGQNGKIYRERNKEGKPTGKRICNICWQKYDPNSQWGLLKSVENRRTGNLDPNSNNAKGDRFEELTSVWKGVKILSKEEDNYRLPIDHSQDFEGKIFQTKGRLYDSTHRQWNFTSLDREWNKIFDYEICYCANKDGTLIEKVLIFPKAEIIKRKGITIFRDNIRGYHWYDEYIQDEETVKKINEIWKKIVDKHKYKDEYGE